MDSIKDYAIILLDPTGKIVSWNPGLERIKGYQPSEVIGQPFAIFYPPEDVERGKPAQEFHFPVADDVFVSIQQSHAALPCPRIAETLPQDLQEFPPQLIEVQEIEVDGPQSRHGLRLRAVALQPLREIVALSAGPAAGLVDVVVERAERDPLDGFRERRARDRAEDRDAGGDGADHFRVDRRRRSDSDGNEGNTRDSCNRPPTEADGGRNRFQTTVSL